MIVLEDCVFCKHKTKTDKSVLGNFKSYCEAFPEGTDGIPDELIWGRPSQMEKCFGEYKFEPAEGWAHLFPNTDCEK